jgi:hypothetical protein
VLRLVTVEEGGLNGRKISPQLEGEKNIQRRINWLAETLDFKPVEVVL